MNARKPLAFFAILMMLFLPVSTAWAQSVHGVLQVVKGNVEIKSSRTGTVTKARMGQKVFPKDVINTAVDSRAKVVMVDGNVINISPESRILIENYKYNPEKNKKDVLINVLYGKIRSKVKQKYDGNENKFRVKTRTAVAGVRGTDFLTSFNQDTKTTKVVTFEGEVIFGKPGVGDSIAQAVPVKPGQFTMNSVDTEVAPPTDLPAAALADLDRESNFDPPSESSQADPRTPAGQEDSGKKRGHQEEGQVPPAPDAERDPAAVDGAYPPPPSGEDAPSPPSSDMFNPDQDLAGGDFNELPEYEEPYVPPEPLEPIFAPDLPECDSCREIVEDGTGGVRIIINTGN